MSEPASSSSNCTFSFKKRARGGGGGGMRQRRKDNSSASSSSEDETTVFKNYKSNLKNPMIQKSLGPKKFKRAGRDDSDNSDDEAAKGVTTILHKSKGAVIEKDDQNAASSRNKDADETYDQRTINDIKEKLHNELKDKEDDKIYRGMNNYAQYIEKRESLHGKRLYIKGPIRAPTNIRTTVRWDYDPMICKDYKETGYCGYGDSCKWMHDRSDYKLGWQLEREEKEAEERRNREGGEESSDDEKYVINSDDDDLPTKCPLCRKVFTTPVVTRCKHYFCEKCALDNYRKSQRCFECGKQTSGMFNPAKDLMERMAKREAAGKTYSDSDEDDDEKLPDESKKTIPEDDPDYYSKVHDPYEDDPNAHESY